MSLLAATFLAAVLGAPADPPAPIDEKLTALVHKLGDRSYRVREAAARDLLRLGSAAVSALGNGMADADPEVSERCRQLMPMAASIDRNEKLATLLKDPAAPPPKGLAGLDRFLKVTGDDKAARELYAEMLGIHYRAIEAADKDPKDGGRELKDFCEEAYSRWQSEVRNGRYSYDNIFATRADVSLFFFLASDTRIARDSAALNRASVLLYSTRINKSLTGTEASPAVRKLFLEWLTNEPLPHMQQRGFQIAAQAGMKEALPVAIKILQKKDQQPYNAAQAMTSLVRLGDKDTVKILVPYMADKSNVGSVNFGNGPMHTIQLRDVAMGVAVQLSGQKPAEFGFDTRNGGIATGSSYIYYGFPDDKSRDEAHQKWKDFAVKNAKK